MKETLLITNQALATDTTLFFLSGSELSQDHLRLQPDLPRSDLGKAGLKTTDLLPISIS